MVEVATGKSFSLPAPGILYDLAWQPGGRRLAGAGFDGAIQLWDVRSRKLERTLARHQLDAVALAFNRRGNLLASAGWDGTVRLWDPLEGTRLLTARLAAEALRFSLDDSRLVVSSIQGEAAYGLPEEPVVRVIPPLPEPQETVWAVDFTPDGGTLAAGTEHGVRLVDVRRAEEIARLPGGRINFVRFSPDGRSLYTGGDGGVWRWPVFHRSRRPAGAPVEELSLGPAVELRHIPASYADSVLSPDARTLMVVHDTYLDMIDVTTGKREAALSNNTPMACAAISPDGRYVATGAWVARGVPVTIWDLKARAKVRELPVHTRAYTAFTRDGRWLLTGEEGQVRFWSPSTWQPAATHVREQSWTWCPIAASPDGRTLALATATNRIELFDVALGRSIAVLDSPDEAPIGILRFSPDGAYLVARSRALRMWDLRLLRRRLAAIGLDWDLPAPTRTNSVSSVNVRVESGIRMGEGAATDWRNYLIERVRKDPKDGFGVNELAWLYVMGPKSVRDAEAGLPYAQRAVELEPANRECWNTLGVVLHRLGRNREALDALRHSVTLGRDGGAAFDYFPMAVCSYRLGQEQQAREYYATGLRLQEAHPVGGLALSELEDLRSEAEETLGLNRR